MQATHQLDLLKSYCSGEKEIGNTPKICKDLRDSAEKYDHLSKFFMGMTFATVTTGIVFTASAITAGTVGTALALYILGAAACLALGYDFNKLRQACEHFREAYKGLAEWKDKERNLIFVHGISKNMIDFNQKKKGPLMPFKAKSKKQQKDIQRLEKELAKRRKKWILHINQVEKLCGQVIFLPNPRDLG